MEHVRDMNRRIVAPIAPLLHLHKSPLFADSPQGIMPVTSFWRIAPLSAIVNFDAEALVVDQVSFEMRSLVWSWPKKSSSII
jgi:hypothetical protein